MLLKALPSRNSLRPVGQFSLKYNKHKSVWNIGPQKSSKKVVDWVFLVWMFTTTYFTSDFTNPSVGSTHPGDAIAPVHQAAVPAGMKIFSTDWWS